jgi:hypothetical protein
MSLSELPALEFNRKILGKMCSLIVRAALLPEQNRIVN